MLCCWSNPSKSPFYQTVYTVQSQSLWAGAGSPTRDDPLLRQLRVTLLAWSRAYLKWLECKESAQIFPFLNLELKSRFQPKKHFFGWTVSDDVPFRNQMAFRRMKLTRLAVATGYFRQNRPQSNWVIGLILVGLKGNHVGFTSLP